MELRELINKIQNQKQFEYLKEILGNKFGSLIYNLVIAADKADKELDIVHSCITELYDIEVNSKQIKTTLKKIDNLYK